MNPRLLALAFGNFVIGTGAMVVAGLLNVIAVDLSVAPAAVGQLIGAFAIAICISGPLLGGLTSRMERRTLLTASLALYALLHALAALAPGYWTLMLVRVLTALAGTIYTPQAAATAGLLVGPEHRGRAIAAIFLGWSISAVFGVPGGAWLGAHFGWRVAMLAVGALSMLGAVLIFRYVPGRLYVAPVNRAAWRTIFRHPVLLPVVAVTAIQGAAQFMLFSYIALAYYDRLAATPTQISLLLAVFGAAGVIGNLVTARVVDHFGTARMVMVSISLMLAAFLIWPLTQGSLGMAVVATVLWGWGCFSANSAQQIRLVALEPALASVSVALNSSAIYFGQFAGAAIGGIALGLGGSAVLSWLGIPVFLVAIWLSAHAQRRATALLPLGVRV